MALFDMILWKHPSNPEIFIHRFVSPEKEACGDEVSPEDKQKAINLYVLKGKMNELRIFHPSCLE